MDWLFYLGIIFLPFENFFFAPTRGWAAISPIIFFFYVLFNNKYLSKLLYKYRFLIFVILWVGLITCLNFLFIDQYVRAAILRTINTLISLGLGIFLLFAFDIHFLQKKKNFNKVVKIIVFVYFISLLIGFIQYITVKYNITFLREFDALITKRSYLKFNRLQFTFTEPSFIGMHLFGVLLPIYITCKKKSLLYLIIIYTLFGFIFSKSVRIIFDAIIIAAIYMIFQLNTKKLNIRMILLFIIFLFVCYSGFSYAYNNSGRFREIVNEGIYGDGSFSSRFFRVNASVKGYKNDFVHALIGYGYGQEIYPLKKGYNEARWEYKSNYLKEVNELAVADHTGEESTSYSMYTRIASECGLIIFVILLYKYLNYFFRKADKHEKAIMLISLYLYSQFESYAFYNLWLIIVLLQLKFIVKKSYKESRKM